jgi:hypothetical protein
MWLAGETEVLGENLLQRHSVHHKFHLPDPGANPGCGGGKPATNRLSYGAALIERESNYKSIFFFKKGRAQSCRGLPLGSSSITTAVALVDRDMLTRVWDEMDYRIDVCRITKCGHIEHL